MTSESQKRLSITLRAAICRGVVRRVGAAELEGGAQLAPAGPAPGIGDELNYFLEYAVEEGGV